MVKKSDKILNGMNEICAFVGMSEPTVLSYIRDLGFPASRHKKLATWHSHKDEIEEWMRCRAAGETYKKKDTVKK